MEFEIKYKEFYDWFDNRYGVKMIVSQITELMNRKWSIRHIFKRLKELVDIVTVLVAAIEYFSNDVRELENDEKVEIAAEFLDDLIVLPFYLEPIDAPLFKLAISWAVDRAKRLFDWGEDPLPPSASS